MNDPRILTIATARKPKKYVEISENPRYGQEWTNCEYYDIIKEKIQGRCYR